MSEYLRSHNAEVLRADEIDQSMQYDLFQRLYAIIESALSYSGGRARQLLVERRESLQRLSFLGYMFLTSCVCRSAQTLGQEYCYTTYLHEGDEERLLQRGELIARHRKVLAFALQFFAGAVAKSTVAQLFRRLVPGTGNGDGVLGLVLAELAASAQRADELIGAVLKVNRALFLINSQYEKVSQRVLQVRQIYVKQPTQGNYYSYAKFGYLQLITLALRAAEALAAKFALVRSLRREQQLRAAQGGSALPGQDEEADLAPRSQQVVCSICLDQCRQVSSTPCGHLFCWECIIENTVRNGKCPSCQNHCAANQIVFLRNGVL